MTRAPTIAPRTGPPGAEAPRDAPSSAVTPRRADPARPWPRRLVRALDAVARETIGLVLPLACPCGREGCLLCGRCAEEIRRGPVRVDAACAALQVLSRADAVSGDVNYAPVMPVVALGEHDGRLQRLVLAWKNGGCFALTAPLAAALADGLALIPGALEEQAGARSGSGGGALILVPVPSSLASRCRRGEDHTRLLALHLARLAGAGVESPLVLRGTSQRGRDRRARRDRSGAVSVRRPLPAGARVVLVDDVATTGSTLRACRDALIDSGAEVLGALVVAGAPEPARAAPAAASAPPD